MDWYLNEMIVVGENVVFLYYIFYESVILFSRVLCTTNVYEGLKGYPYRLTGPCKEYSKTRAI